MSVIRVLAQLDRDTLVPEDLVQNTWHFTTQDDIDPGRLNQALSAMTAVDSFYDAISPLWSPAMAGTGILKAYDLSEPEPRVPMATLPILFTVGSTQSLPGEAAVCVSFQGELISGENQARRRGRVFIGMLTTGAAENATGGIRPIEEAFVAAGQGLLDDSELATDWSWIVFSPTTAGPENPDGTFPNLTQGITVVDNGWVDNAFDTIRSRGLGPTARVVFE